MNTYGPVSGQSAHKNPRLEKNVISQGGLSGPRCSHNVAGLGNGNSKIRLANRLDPKRR